MSTVAKILSTPNRLPIKTGGPRGATDTVDAKIPAVPLPSTASRVVAPNTPGREAALTPGEGVVRKTTFQDVFLPKMEEWEQTGKVDGKTPAPWVVKMFQSFRDNGGDEAGDPGEATEGYCKGGKVGYAGGGQVQPLPSIRGAEDPYADYRTATSQALYGHVSNPKARGTVGYVKGGLVPESTDELRTKIDANRADLRNRIGAGMPAEDTEALRGQMATQRAANPPVELPTVANRALAIPPANAGRLIAPGAGAALAGVAAMMYPREAGAADEGQPQQWAQNFIDSPQRHEGVLNRPAPPEQGMVKPAEQIGFMPFGAIARQNAGAALDQAAAKLRGTVGLPTQPTATAGPIPAPGREVQPKAQILPQANALPMPTGNAVQQAIARSPSVGATMALPSAPTDAQAAQAAVTPGKGVAPSSRVIAPPGGLPIGPAPERTPYTTYLYGTGGGQIAYDRGAPTPGAEERAAALGDEMERWGGEHFPTGQRYGNTPQTTTPYTLPQLRQIASGEKTEAELLPPAPTTYGKDGKPMTLSQLQAQYAQQYRNTPVEQIPETVRRVLLGDTGKGQGKDSADNQFTLVPDMDWQPPLLENGKPDTFAERPMIPVSFNKKTNRLQKLTMDTAGATQALTPPPGFTYSGRLTPDGKPIWLDAKGQPHI